MSTRSELTVRPITREEHRAYVERRVGEGGSVSFLQTPAWGEVKAEWLAESLGWFGPGDPDPVGAALVLYRQLPKLKRYLAYLPEGPDIDWTAEHLSDWLAPLTRHLATQRAFAVRMGPPVVTRRWSADALKDGLADDAVRRLDDVAPTAREPDGARVVSQLRELGWLEQGAGAGFAAGQPRHNFMVPLHDDDGKQLSEDAVLKAMNSMWRRNIKKAAKEGVDTRRVPQSELKDALDTFHRLYVHTAERDGFTPRPAAYFQTMFAALGAEDPDRICLFTAEHEGDLVAATILVQVGSHAWYSYGASSTDKREVRGSNAVQWAMIRHALDRGAAVYDLRGITDTLDADDPQVGLIRFKVGTGGEAVEYAGEWDLPLGGLSGGLMHKAFLAYLKRRG